MIWLIWYCLLVSAAAELESPRVALLFLSRGSMPLEKVWHKFLGSIASLELPTLNQQQWDEAMETERTSEARKRIREAGRMSANNILREADCVNNAMIKVRCLSLVLGTDSTHESVLSWSLGTRAVRIASLATWQVLSRMVKGGAHRKRAFYVDY